MFKPSWILQAKRDFAIFRFNGLLTIVITVAESRYRYYVKFRWWSIHKTGPMCVPSYIMKSCLFEQECRNLSLRPIYSCHKHFFTCNHRHWERTFTNEMIFQCCKMTSTDSMGLCVSPYYMLQRKSCCSQLSRRIHAGIEAAKPISKLCLES